MILSVECVLTYSIAMLIHTLNLTPSEVEFAQFPGRELLVPRLKGRKGRGREAEQRTKGGRERREGNDRDGGKRTGGVNEGKGRGEMGVKFCCNALGGMAMDAPAFRKACG